MGPAEIGGQAHRAFPLFSLAIAPMIRCPECDHPIFLGASVFPRWVFPSRPSTNCGRQHFPALRAGWDESSPRPATDEF
jgi:hypothetical protein